ncbi:polyglutamine-binding protein 1 [Schistocerca nitens]|uniref:polyglutamine-binding protein 1 n=1 Tax=Schistocerca nitens TaxID=7011 RepID=UPI00211734A5|nr:polyglutamine-binding protein 1 [Schistocerca nitens]
MPLPQKLALRLAKRGLLSTNDVVANKTATVPAVEEVIAEDYDGNKNTTKEKFGDDFLSDVDLKIMGHPGCPNKYNIYHECSVFCQKHWGDGITEPDSKYLAKKRKLLRKYPLPQNWIELYDPGTGRHYYWESENDLVSWLPPSHPRAVVSESAAHMREEMRLAEGDDEEEDEAKDSENDEDAEMSDEEDRPETYKEELHRKKDRRDRNHGRMKAVPNDLDPMDPASYSETPRGTWATGLWKKNEAKTGADTTAAGPLYQMRPYPSPGSVLRANAMSKATDKSRTVSQPELPSK